MGHGINAAILGATALAIPGGGTTPDKNIEDAETNDLNKAEEERTEQLGEVGTQKELIINTDIQDIVRVLIPEINDAIEDGDRIILRG